MQIKSYSTKRHWERIWENTKPEEEFIPSYHPLIASLLPKNEKWACFEAGCIPGRYLMYFHKQFGYKPTGVDFSDKTGLAKEYFKRKNIKAEIYKSDFFKFNTKKKYNLVASHGFVEHFGEPELVFKKHWNLLADKGFLIITLPNFRYLQYYLHKIFDSRTLKTHNFDVMYPDLWRKLAQKHKMKIHYCDYYETFDFWIVRRSLWLKPFIKAAGLTTGATRFLLKRTGLSDVPNKYLSPNILLIAQKR